MLDPTLVRARLDELRRLDPKRLAPGASAHGYTLEAPLRGPELEAAERSLGVRLPEQYRHFLTQLGAGGAGPGRGITPLSCGPDGRWEWIDEHGSAAGALKKPFAHSEAWNPRWHEQPFLDEDHGEPRGADRYLAVFEPRAEYDESAGPKKPASPALLLADQRRYSRWYDAYFAAPDGAVCLTQHAVTDARGGEDAGEYEWLVVHGPLAGTLWIDRRNSRAGLLPSAGPDGAPLDFDRWYSGWLERALSAAGGGAP